MVIEGREFMTFAKCAEELGCHEQTIGRYIDRGELKCLFVGGRRRVTRALWEHFLATHTTTGALVEVDDDD